ncbi:MAG TPA: hypothetical protein VG387_03290 [Rhizomicrobium sp.]|jgi:hypothetical protein|nr:hypothetical protein [Rhizomicrobium sp.]
MDRIAFPLTLAAGILLASTAFASTAAVSLQSAPAAIDNNATVPAATPAAPQTASGNDGDQIVCKNQPIIGSRLSSRLCLPKHRWAQMHQDGQDFMRNLDERSSGGQERPQ